MVPTARLRRQYILSMLLHDYTQTKIACYTSKRDRFRRAYYVCKEQAGNVQ